MRYVHQGATRVVGIDSSAFMVGEANEKIEIFGSGGIVKALQIDADGDWLAFNDNSFDMVTSTFALHYVENLDPAWREIGRVVRHEGVLAFTVPHPLTGFRRKGDKNYEETTLLKVKLFDEAIEVFSYSHTFKDYLSQVFFSRFVVEDFTEFPDMAPRAGDLGVPGAFGVKARRKE